MTSLAGEPPRIAETTPRFELDSASRPRILDLFSCAGGAARGYQQAGFYVVGVDIEPQPRYAGDLFIQADAIEVLNDLLWSTALDVPLIAAPFWDVRHFDAIHASPPCQDHSGTKRLTGDHGTGWLLDATLERLTAIGLPWVAENVIGAALPHQDDLFGSHGLTLCGCMFPELRGLIYEDRLFGTSFPVAQPAHSAHVWPQTKMGRPPKTGECMQVTGHFSDAAEARRRMQAPWMTRDELAQAIPPAYAAHLGRCLLEHLQTEAAA